MTDANTRGRGRPRTAAIAADVLRRASQARRLTPQEQLDLIILPGQPTPDQYARGKLYCYHCSRAEPTRTVEIHFNMYWDTANDRWKELKNNQLDLKPPPAYTPYRILKWQLDDAGNWRPPTSAFVYTGGRLSASSSSEMKQVRVNNTQPVPLAAAADVDVRKRKYTSQRKLNCCMRVNVLQVTLCDITNIIGVDATSFDVTVKSRPRGRDPSSDSDSSRSEDALDSDNDNDDNDDHESAAAATVPPRAPIAAIDGITIDDNSIDDAPLLLLLIKWKTDHRITDAALSELLAIIAATRQKPIATLKIARRELYLKPKYKRYTVCTGCYQIHEPVKAHQRAPAGSTGGELQSIACGAQLLGGKKCDVVLYEKDDFVGSATGKRPVRATWPRTVRFTPRLEYQYMPLIDQLTTLLRRPDFEELVVRWQTRQQPAESDIICDNYDATSWRQRRCHLNKLYHRHNDGTRLPLTVTLVLDWFGLWSTTQYSAGTIYLIIDQLPIEVRYQRKWVIALAALPGGSEKKINLSHLLKPLVTELLELWRGRMFNTYAYPDGRLVEVILSMVLCDSIAARRTIGFVAPTGNRACHICWCHFGPRHDAPDDSKGDGKTQGNKDDDDEIVTTDEDDDSDDDIEQDTEIVASVPREKRAPKVKKPKGPRACLEDITNIEAKVPLRVREEHVNYGTQWLKASTADERTRIVREYGYSYTILLSLPYFSPSESTPVDWLHVGPLGVAKCYFNRIIATWKPKTIRRVQERLDELSPPRYMTRAGFSFKSIMKHMTGDQMIAFVTSYSVYVLRGILSTEQSLVWCHLVIIMRMATQYSFTQTQLVTLKKHIDQFVSGFATLYPKRSVPPNFHMLRHFPSCIRQFGPPFAIWTMATERLNGWMKSVNTNGQHPDEQLIKVYWTSHLLYDATHRYTNVIWTDATRALMARYNTKDSTANSHRRWISAAEAARLRNWVVTPTPLNGSEAMGDHQSIRLLNYLPGVVPFNKQTYDAVVEAFKLVLYPSHEYRDITRISVAMSNRCASRVKIGNDIITSELWRSWRGAYVQIRRQGSNGIGTRMHAGRVVMYSEVSATFEYSNGTKTDDVPHLLALVNWFNFPAGVPHASLEAKAPLESRYGHAYSWAEWIPSLRETGHHWIPVTRLQRIMPADVVLANKTHGFHSLWLPSSYAQPYGEQLTTKSYVSNRVCVCAR
jgi:hypothetical protein